jgi:hypothetical protein
LEVNVKKGKVTPQNVREYRVMVSIRAYAEDGAALRDPGEGYEEHALTAIIPLEDVAAVGLEHAATNVVKKLVYDMQRTGWPV